MPTGQFVEIHIHQGVTVDEKKSVVLQNLFYFLQPSPGPENLRLMRSVDLEVVPFQCAENPAKVLRLVMEIDHHIADFTPLQNRQSVSE
jgi:hypothetical protein